jgi:hypothetical protein
MNMILGLILPGPEGVVNKNFIKTLNTADRRFF